ncbi:MAG: hypothetical protein ACOCZT_02675 [Halanaerobiales bacterium]
MSKIFNNKLWGYLGRFSLTHVVTYTGIAVAFVIFQNTMPASERIALDFFKPYSQPGFMVIFQQVIRGGVMALILYPFYDIILKNNRGWLILFAALFGLGLLGSVNPMPGSIEGLIYTKTTLVEHLMVLVTGAIQVFIFSWGFLKWENWCNHKNITTSNKGIEINE